MAARPRQFSVAKLIVVVTLVAIGLAAIRPLVVHGGLDAVVFVIWLFAMGGWFTISGIRFREPVHFAYFVIGVALLILSISFFVSIVSKGESVAPTANKNSGRVPAG